MNNNTIFNKILHLTGAGRNIEQLINIFELGGIQATPSKIKGWRTAPDNKRHSPMPDRILEAFFDGFFVYRDSLAAYDITLFNLVKNKDERVEVEDG